MKLSKKNSGSDVPVEFKVKRSDYINGAFGISKPLKIPNVDGFVWHSDDQMHAVKISGSDSLQKLNGQRYADGRRTSVIVDIVCQQPITAFSNS